jgi:hypothetical protein
MHVKDLIRALGGNAAVGKVLGVKPQAISDWFRRGVIPARHHLRLWAMAQQRGIAWRPPHADAIERQPEQVAA